MQISLKLPFWNILGYVSVKKHSPLGAVLFIHYKLRKRDSEVFINIFAANFNGIEARNDVVNYRTVS